MFNTSFNNGFQYPIQASPYPQPLTQEQIVSAVAEIAEFINKAASDMKQAAILEQRRDLDNICQEVRLLRRYVTDKEFKGLVVVIRCMLTDDFVLAENRVRYFLQKTGRGYKAWKAIKDFMNKYDKIQLSEDEVEELICITRT